MTAKKNILVVDDERDILDLIQYNLSKEGYTVTTALNGKEALDKADAKTDLVILDLMMPVLDGFETCKRLKGAPATASVPVVFLTARASEVDEVVGLELGADDYIQKPISPRKLVARVKAVLRRREQQSEDTAEAPPIRIGRLEIDRRSYTVRHAKRKSSSPAKNSKFSHFLPPTLGKCSRVKCS